MLYVELDRKGRIKRLVGRTKVRDIRRFGLFEASRR